MSSSTASPTPSAPADHPAEPGDQLRHAAGAGLVLAALGVVFGDIGTSPLYALQTVFSIDHGAVRPTVGDVYGVISLMFWSITLIVVGQVRRRPHARRQRRRGRRHGARRAGPAPVRGPRPPAPASLVVLGHPRRVALLRRLADHPGDQRAVRGRGPAGRRTRRWATSSCRSRRSSSPCLFAAQRFGTGKVGALFGPVMLLWFARAGRRPGSREIVAAPRRAAGASRRPTRSLFVVAHPVIAFIAMGAVVLVITGAEALYADMGHFGRSADPARLVLRRLPGADPQLPRPGGADPAPPGRASPTRSSCCFPSWARLPMVVLATAATVIASQAVISGAFSLSRQAMQLGLLPPVTVRQTSEHEGGQIYLPGVNAVLFVGVLVVMLTFRSVGSGSRRRTACRSPARSWSTRCCCCSSARVLWQWPPWKLAARGRGVRRCRGSPSWPRTCPRWPTAGGCPCSSRSCVFTVMTTWRRGRAIVSANRREKEGSLRTFVDDVRERGDPAGAGHRRLPAPGEGHHSRWPCGPTSSTTTSCTRTSSSCRPARPTCPHVPAAEAVRRGRPGLRRRRHPAPVGPLRVLRRARPARGRCGRRATPGAPGARAHRRRRRVVLPVARGHPPDAGTGAWPGGARRCSSSSRTTPPTPPPTSASPGTAP